GGTARDLLMEKFQFTKEQAQAIVDMRLRALTGLEKKKLQDEFDALQILIAELTKILNDENYLLEVLTDELSKIKDKFGDARRTAIVLDSREIIDEDLIDEAQSVITLSNLGYIKRISLDAYRSQGRGGRGVMGMQTREEDWVTDLFVANTHDNILFFTTRGRAFRLRAYEIPEAGRTAKGMPLINLLNFSNGETIAGMIPVTKNDWEGYLIMVTRKGLVKRTALSHYSRINKSGLNAINFREEDTLIKALRSDGAREICMATKNGSGIRFAENQAREVGRVAIGVRGMKLRDGDEIIGATVADGQVLLVSANGYGKVTAVENFRGQKRGGLGIRVFKPSEKRGTLVGIEAVNENDGLMIINSEGVVIRIRIADISVQSRLASGVKLINMQGETTVVSIAKIPDDDNNSDEEIINAAENISAENFADDDDENDDEVFEEDENNFDDEENDDEIFEDDENNLDDEENDDEIFEDENNFDDDETADEIFEEDENNFDGDENDDE
ncbi:MAG: DNA gyrase subunit A, partial [Defluviitaleaceae bacterium]|nr:DNA gyrase subunit A [Defluviitaleaceae bacterium]